jgi:hypothetical protein
MTGFDCTCFSDVGSFILFLFAVSPGTSRNIVSYIFCGPHIDK